MPDTLNTYLDELTDRFAPLRTKGWASQIQFLFRDAEPVLFMVENCALAVHDGVSGEPLSTVETDVSSFIELFSGKAPLDLMLMTGRIKTDNILEVIKLQSVFDRPASKT